MSFAQAIEAQRRYQLGELDIEKIPAPRTSSQRMDPAEIRKIFDLSRTGQFSVASLAEHMGRNQSTIKRYAAPDRRWRKGRSRKNATN